MAQGTGQVIRRCVLTVLSLLMPALGGCRSAALPTYMQPELLYLNDHPYARLYIEVDAIEGVDVPQAWLDELEAFLARHSSKPKGITTVRDAPVPRAQVLDLPMDLVAILCTDGPPGEDGEQPAYLHVVFYDSRIWPHQKARPPHIVASCPSAILCDVNYAFRTWKDKVAGAILEHEAGHVLGLCKDREHGTGSHCRRPGCLMQRTPGTLSEIGLLVGAPMKKNLCAACEHDLDVSRSQTEPNSLSFAGPFLVRRQDGYSVVRLPHYDLLLLGPHEKDFDWHRALSWMKQRVRDGIAKEEDHKSSRSKGMPHVFDMLHPKGMDHGSDSYGAALRQMAQDPCPDVRRFVRWMQEKGPASEPASTMR